VDHPEEISKLAKVKAQVSEVKGVMMENIEKVQISYWFSLPV
jgi:vesicle-associated membrane protein 72